MHVNESVRTNTVNKEMVQNQLTHEKQPFMYMYMYNKPASHLDY